MTSLPPPLPPGLPSPPAVPPPAVPPAGVSGTGDDWQLPGDRWLPAGYRMPPGRPGWQVDPVGWQHVGVPEPDPLVAHRGFGDWFVTLAGVVRRSWRPLLVLQLVYLPVTVAAIVAVVPPTSRGSLLGLRRGGRLTADDRELALRLSAVAVAALVGWVASVVVRGAGAWFVTHDAAGQETTWGAAVRFGLRRFWAFVGWSAVTGLVTVLGLLACLVPGIYLAVVFNTLLTGVVAFERRDTWGRCFGLARGAWWALAGRVAVLGLIGAVYGAAVNAVTGALVAGGGAAAEIGAGMLGSVLRLPVGIVSAGAAIVTYAERRGRTSGCTTHELLADLHR